MPDLNGLAGALLGLIIGWALKTWADAWTWRRQHLLDSYVAVLDAADRSRAASERLWSTGTPARSHEWVDSANQVQHVDLETLDCAAGKHRLVADRRGAELALRLFVACHMMFRRAIAWPPASGDSMREATNEMARAYEELLDHGRHELAVGRWRERFSRRESIGELSTRLFAQLQQTDPHPPEAEKKGSA